MSGEAIHSSDDPVWQRLICVDLETTGVDVKACEVVQVAGIERPSRETGCASLYDPLVKTRDMLCKPRQPIPSGATQVHGIADVDVADCPHFGAVAKSVAEWLDTGVLVTYNGTSFDIPVIKRHVPSWKPGPQIDVFRLWSWLRRVSAVGGAFDIPADLMTGSLSSAHAWCEGGTFDGAHDALADCFATMAVLRHLQISQGWSTLACVELTKRPLPGDVDWSGKLKWDGDSDRVLFAFGKHKGLPVYDQLGVRGYVEWMLNKGDFPADTCEILRDMKRGKMPKREATS